MTLPSLKPVHVSAKSSVNQLSSELLVVVADESQIQDKSLAAPELKRLNDELGGVLSEIVELGDFSGKWLQTSVTLSKTPEVAKRILLIGAGKKADRTAARAREMGLKVGEFVTEKKLGQVALLPLASSYQLAKIQSQFAIGTSMGVFKYPISSFDATAKAELERPVEISLVSEQEIPAELLAETNSLIHATALCRYLQDSPPNIAYPQAVAQIAKARADQLGLKTTICGRADLEKMGFGAMLAVSRGSAHEPQFVIIEYTPAEYEKTIAFVGKGLTMDAGGYSLKPSNSQVGMRYDMSGAAITLSAIAPIAEQKLPIRVLAIAALCENMVDAHAYRVNDVLTSYSGKTIEVRNTDAEGRIVLCDALAYTAKELKPDYIFEYSTLTGAIVVALGGYGAGLFSHPDQRAAEVVQKASEESSERVWQMPVWEEVVNDLKTSTVADLTNIQATAGSAGSSTAAAFLFEFVEDIPFAHIDVAGVAFNNSAMGHPRKTGSGYGVQLSYEIARTLSKN